MRSSKRINATIKAVVFGVLLAVLPTALVTGCVTFPPASELGEEHQVLAIRATPPEVAPGATVILDALVHWPGGDPTLLWLVCLPDVGDNIGSCLSTHLPSGAAPPLCTDEPLARVCLAGVGDTVPYAVPASVLDDDGEQHTFFVYMLAAGGADPLGQCQEPLAGGAPTPDCLLSIKRVVVSGRDRANRNPIVTGLRVAGETVDPTGVAAVQVDSADLESYQLSLGVTLEATSIDELLEPADPTGDPTLDPTGDPAQLTVQWFTTCGEIADPLTYFDVSVDGLGGLTFDSELTGWKPQQTGDCWVHAVVRDALGGAGFFSQQIWVTSTPALDL